MDLKLCSGVGVGVSSIYTFSVSMYDVTIRDFSPKILFCNAFLNSAPSCDPISDAMVGEDYAGVARKRYHSQVADIKLQG